MSEKSAWRVVGASVPGVSHRRGQQPCQDSHHWQSLPANAFAVGVADGAGSAACAEIGAVTAARHAVEEVARHFRADIQDWLPFLRDVLRATRREVLDHASLLEIEGGDFATTLLVAVVLPDVLAVAQVGDGAVVARWADGSFQSITRPCAREYVNETTFLTSDSYLEQAQLTVQCGALSGLALFTDGLQRLALKLPQADPHPAFFAPLLDRVGEASSRDRAEKKLEEFLQSPRLSERTEDDLTLVLAVPEKKASQ